MVERHQESHGQTRRARLVAVVAVCAIAASPLAAPANADSGGGSDDSDSGVAGIDIEAVMQEFGVSRDEAQARLEFEAHFSRLVNEIAVEIPSYVDSALAADFGTLSGTVLLADATDSEWRTAEDILEPLEGSVELASARLNEAEEEALFATAYERLSWLEAAGQTISLGWSAVGDELTVVVAGSTEGIGSSDRDRIQSELGNLASTVTVRDGPETFTEDCPSNPTKTGGSTEGGRLIAECGNNDCTAGFSVRSETNTSITGILTAAHCNDFVNDTDDWWYIRMADGSTPYSTVRYADHGPYNRGDIMFLREWFASATPRHRVYRYGQNWTDIFEFQWENPQNTTVIAKGGQTADEFGHLWANMVGQIVSNTVSVETNETAPDANNRYAAVDYGDDTGSTSELSPRGGDSGSPVWISANRHAVGIHKGGGPGWEIYSKIGYSLAHMDLEMLP